MVKNRTHLRPAAALAALLFAFAAFSATSAASAATGVSPAVVIAPTLTPEFSAAIADARTEVAELVASEGGSSSLSLALVDGDSVIWSESFGYLDRTRDLRPDADTRYGLASGSKMFAALSVMILADRGLVFSGLSPDGELVELVELRGHPWFVACQFHPEFQSTPLAAHPLFRGFVAAARRAGGAG